MAHVGRVSMIIQSQSKFARRLPFVALFVITFAAYLPATWAGFIWDDPAHVTGNPQLRNLAGLARMWTVPTSLPQWYPMVHTTFWIEYHLWHLNPIGYHIDNILLQIAGAILLWRLLEKLQVQGAWLAAALFAVHPIHVESVAWITERKNTLSAFFYLLAALAYLRAVDLSQRRIDWNWYLGSIALFTAAMFSKTVACTFPAAALLIVYWKSGRIRWRDIRPTIPFFAIGIMLGIVTAVLERTHVKAVGPAFQFSIAQRLLIAGRALWFYAGKLAVPWPLAFIYARWNVSGHVPWQYLFPLAAVAAIAAVWLLRGRIGRGPVVAVLFFAGTLFPALGFFNIYPMRFSFVADHFQHLASAGLTTLLAVGIARVTNVQRAIGNTIATTVLLICVVLTYVQCGVYADAVTLWRDTVVKTPGSWMVYTNLGRALEAEGRPLEGIPYHEQALQLEATIPDTHHNVAEGDMMRGKLDDAEREFRSALAIDPHFAPAYLGLAKLEFFQRHDVAKAEQYFKQCFALEPGYGAAHFAYGEMLESEGNLTGAAEHYRLTLDDLPEDFDAHYNLGTVLIKLSRPAEAVGPLRQAVELNPNNAAARMNLEVALKQSGHSAEAEAMQQAEMRARLSR